MDCEAASERLPWLLTGAMEAQEADQVRGHLTECPRCRAEMEETRRAAAVFGAHLPTAALLELAWDGTVEGLEPALVDQHLAGCADCEEELALARESRQLERGAATAASRARRPAWPLVALPATLAAGLVVGLWWGAGRGADGPSSGEREEDRFRVSALESEVRGLRSRVANLQSAAEAVRLPRLNLPVFEILPGSQVRRGRDADDNEIVVPAAATEIALLLSAEAASGTATLTIRDQGDREVWRGDGLVYGPPGGYVVTVPVRLLPEGRYVIGVRPKRGAELVYRIRVRHRA